MRTLILTALSLIAIGCAGPVTPPMREGEPAGMQLQRVDPSLKQTPFRVLLDFETPADLAFIAADSPRLDNTLAHTGNSSLLLGAGASKLAVKLPALFSEGSFPDGWTMVGAYFYSDAAFNVTASYADLNRTVSIPAGQWTAVMLDVSALSDPNTQPAAPRELLFTFSGATGPVHCDDLLVANDARTLVDTRGADAEHRWTVKHRGFATFVDSPGRFSLTLPTPEAGADGWRVEEANSIRLVLRSTAGSTYTIYSDGRAYRDGAFAPLVSFGSDGQALAEQHQSPAQIAVPESDGRINRTSKGDLHNDGYNQLLGSYQVVATAEHLEISLTPRSHQLLRPVIEIEGFPQGPILVLMQGKLVQRVCRNTAGHVLVELPASAEGTTVVNLSLR